MAYIEFMPKDRQRDVEKAEKLMKKFFAKFPKYGAHIMAEVVKRNLAEQRARKARKLPDYLL